MPPCTYASGLSSIPRSITSPGAYLRGGAERESMKSTFKLGALALMIQLAGAAFLDTGDAFDGFADMKLKQSAGLGLRVLFPQLDRVVMRVDVGFPFQTCPTGKCSYTTDVMPKNHAPDVVLTFRQAFGMPVLPAND